MKREGFWCLGCKYCLPPAKRENGYCNEDECHMEPYDVRDDKELKAMTMDEANEKLNHLEKHRWVNLQNHSANLYSYHGDKIKKVDPAGWWY